MKKLRSFRRGLTVSMLLIKISWKLCIKFEITNFAQHIIFYPNFNFVSYETVLEELNEFQLNSHELEAELETQLTQTEVKLRDLKVYCSKLQNELEDIKVWLTFSSKFPYWCLCTSLSMCFCLFRISIAICNRAVTSKYQILRPNSRHWKIIRKLLASTSGSWSRQMMI